MVKVRKMDESSFAKLVKEVNAVGEVIRERQDQKQSVFDSFDREKKLYKSGKISRKTLSSSAKKTNAEIRELDNEMRGAMKKVDSISNQIKRFSSRQSPQNIKVRLGSKKKAKRRKKKI